MRRRSPTEEGETPNLEGHSASVIEIIEEGERRRSRGCGDDAYAKPPDPPIKLDWLVDDFAKVTSSVYEAVMVSARRARQVGRRQKQEIDAYNATHDITEIGVVAEEAIEPGQDHFRHAKPTLKALDELKRNEIKFAFKGKEDK